MGAAAGALVGAAAGCLATAPMSVAMTAMHGGLPWYQRYALPPRQILERATDAFGLRHPTDHGLGHVGTLAAHFGYGAACGAAYGAVASPLRLGGPLTGLLFGLGVWAVSYVGFLPALGLFDAPDEQPGRRNALMVAAHVVWGLALGMALRALGGHDAAQRYDREY